MTGFAIDLQDGQEPVSFNLRGGDAERFQTFMAKYHTLQQAVNDAHQRVDNVVAANKIPMPDSLRVHALKEFTESLRDDLAEHVDES